MTLATVVGVGLASLAIVAGLAVRIRVVSRRRFEVGLSDSDIRRIEERGALHLEDPEPLDLDEIRAEEDRFWAERWDEADEW